MDIREIQYVWDNEEQIHTADIVVGDGTIVYDAEYDEYDDRIFFYFYDEEEYKLAFHRGGLVGCDFTIMSEVL